MGNEGSKVKGLVVDKTAIEANDFWTLYNAESPTTSNAEGKQYLSIFQGEPVVNGQLWVTQAPIERSVKNLMIYRHPYILKYMATWEKGGQRYLATERVQPLGAVLNTQSDTQICLGLRTILCSLIFLVEKAMARHLNICISSIYITESGSWKLAGFEYVWKRKDLTKSVLNLANSYRYQPAIDTDEGKDNNIDCIEQYAFATLCEEILSKTNTTKSSIPHVQSFRDYCATHLKHKNLQLRPKLSAILLHPYFNHEFITIHSFLFELPLKSVQERKEFFSGLIDRLRYFDEEVVGAQLTNSLLSRMVLLDATAQFCVTPYVLRTRADHSPALFSHSTYSRYLMPQIKRMFRIRDAQIRLILLEYFMEYVSLLTKEELEEFILPHLHEGMMDTNDVLVAKTLRCMADLIPLLGAGKVLGGNRERLFSDGRPQAAIPDSSSHWVEPRSITPVLGNNDDYMLSSSPIPDSHIELSSSQVSLTLSQTVTTKQLDMPQRLSPDGGEDDKSIPSMSGVPSDDAVIENKLPDNIDANKVEIESNIEFEEEDVWSDWDTDDLHNINDETRIKHVNRSNSSNSDENIKSANVSLIKNNFKLKTTNLKPDTLSQGLQSQSSLTDSYHTTRTNASSATSLKQPFRIKDDLNAFDINVKNIEKSNDNTNGGEFDFFKDMEPVININSNSMLVENNLSTVEGPKKNEENIVINSNRFAAVVTLDAACTEPGGGWGTDDDDNDSIPEWKA